MSQHNKSEPYYDVRSTTMAGKRYKFVKNNSNNNSDNINTTTINDNIIDDTNVDINTHNSDINTNFQPHVNSNDMLNTNITSSNRNNTISNTIIDLTKISQSILDKVVKQHYNHKNIHDDRKHINMKQQENDKFNNAFTIDKTIIDQELVKSLSHNKQHNNNNNINNTTDIITTLQQNIDTKGRHFIINQHKSKHQTNKPITSGKQWFNLSSQPITPELKKDIYILANRSIINPNHFFKREKPSNLLKDNKFIQVGTVIEAPHEYYSSRLKRKERSHSIAQEVLNDTYATNYLKRRMTEVQKANTPIHVYKKNKKKIKGKGKRK